MRNSAEKNNPTHNMKSSETHKLMDNFFNKSNTALEHTDYNLMYHINSNGLIGLLQINLI